MAADNRTLGRFHLVGLPPAPRGIPQIEVAFDIDANGILHVTARDNTTGKEQRIQITAMGGLKKEDVERLAREAEEHRAEDEKRRQAIEARNRLDSLAHSTRKTFDEQRAELSADTVDRLTRTLEQAQRLVDAGSDDLTALQRAESELTEAAHQMSEALYRGAGGQPPPGAGPRAGQNPRRPTWSTRSTRSTRPHADSGASA